MVLLYLCLDPTCSPSIARQHLAIALPKLLQECDGCDVLYYKDCRYTVRKILLLVSMPQAILNEILSQLQSLDVSELQCLNRAVQDYLAHKERDSQKLAFHQALLGSGLVRQIKTYSSRSPIKRQLIRVQGHPISMTIVEERR